MSERTDRGKVPMAQAGQGVEGSDPLARDQADLLITHHSSLITTSRTRIKICGITSAEDATMAVAAGADALGFNFAPTSPRQVTPEDAAGILRTLPPFVTTVGVVVDQDVAAIRAVCPVDAIQFHGEETPRTLAATAGIRRIKAFRIHDEADLAVLANYVECAEAFLLDAYVPGVAGGTGQTFNWELAHRARALGRPILLAGGLTPDNVGAAIRAARPFAVDVASGVEASPGHKDPTRIATFVAAVRETDTSLV